jgi:hypothetical protein
VISELPTMLFNLFAGEVVRAQRELLSVLWELEVWESKWKRDSPSIVLRTCLD